MREALMKDLDAGLASLRASTKIQSTLDDNAEDRSLQQVSVL